MATAFTAARPVAQHCAELTLRGPRPEERAEHLAAWCRDVAHDLATELSALLSGGKLTVALSGPQGMTGREVFDQIGPVAVNSLLRCGDSDQTLLLSIDFATAIALTDCSFGGDGQLPDPPPAQLPRSAGLLVEEIAGVIARVIAIANGAAGRGRPGRGNSDGDVLVRSESVTRLKPFEPSARIACFTVTMAMGESAGWSVLIAVPDDRLDTLLPALGDGAGARGRRRRGPGERADPASGPFAQMPLPLEAVLGEFELSLSKLDRLAPGDEIPLAIPRELPLRIGSEVLAHGTLGTLENRMALRLCRLPGKAAQPTASPANFEGAAE